MSLDIVLWPNPILKKVCEPVVEFDASLEKLAAAMKETMLERRGAGLAANQVGHSIRLFVAELGEGEKTYIQTFVNPVIEPDDGAPLVDSKEGCLSIPGLVARLKCRHQGVSVEAFDVSGRPFHMLLKNRDAVVVAHEQDHLEGRTLFDRMPRVSRMLETKRYAKRQRAQKEGSPNIRRRR